jgi:hypothetical protein
MANTIRIPRSVTTNTPASLAQGELAFSESGSPNSVGELFIGVAGPGIQKIATLTGGSAAEPNDAAQDNQTITTGLGIDGADAGSAGAITISLATTELATVAPVTGDSLVFDDASDSLPKRQLFSATPLSIFNNDAGWTSNLGTVTAVTGGVGVASTGGTTPDISLDFSELTDMVGSISGTTEFILQDGTTESRKAASEIQLQFFDNSVSEFVSENDTMVVADWNWVLDEDAMGSDSAVHVPTQQSVKAYVDSAVTGGMTHKGGYNAATNTPALDTGSPVLAQGDMYTVTVAGTFFTEEVEVGDVLIADVDSVDAASLADWTIVQNNLGAASETVPGYIELATQAEMDTATDDTRAVTPLKYANSTIDGGTF